MRKSLKTYPNPSMKNKEKKKKVKVIYVDDGRTLYDMQGVHRQNAFIPDKVSQSARQKKKEAKEAAHLDRKERNAAIRAGFQVYLPILAIVLASFAIVGLLMYFWLK